jgi:hypothetical protein
MFVLGCSFQAWFTSTEFWDTDTMLYKALLTQEGKCSFVWDLIEET